MNKSVTTGPARAALFDHQGKLQKARSEADTIARRAENFRHVTAAYTNDSTLESLRERRREVLTQVALGERPVTNLDLIDAELGVAEVKYRDNRRESEIAQAGAARLQAQHDAIVTSQIAPLSAALPALRYEAAIEILRERLVPYREALVALAECHRHVVGAALAVDSLADLHASPPRVFVSNRLEQAGLGLPLPALPDLDASEFVVDPDAAAFRAEADSVTVLLAI